ncbi:MAG: hypothetical protein U0625_07950 [Phycisphaerales bacterium]
MSSHGDAFGSLAALFTSGSTEPGGAGAAGAAHDAPSLPFGPVVTVLVGNLPVMAGLWTTQFADAVARRSGPTCLVRYERGDVTLELLHADGRQLPPPGPGAIERWLPRGATSVRRWIVCLPAETPAAEVLAGGTEVLLMTGGDEAAVTGAYLRLKHLAEESMQRGAPMERVGVVLVGASPEQAELAAARLSEAARSFLGIETEIVARLPRLERVESSARATYAAQECPAFAAFMPALARAREEMSHRFDRELQSTPTAAPAMPAPTVAHAAPAPSMPAPAPATPAMPHVAPAPAVHAPATPAPTPAPRAVAADASPAPARLVPLLAGLRPLGISAPVAPEIELALDPANRLHIVGRADQLARVRTVRHWALVHRELLGLAFPDLRGSFEVRERLLLTDAREAIPLHGTGVLLDLLVTAATPAGPVQVVVPLNDPATAGA